MHKAGRPMCSASESAQCAAIMTRPATSVQVKLGNSMCVCFCVCQCRVLAQIAVGFGVSRPEHAKQIVSWGAEGVICGSALVKALGEAPSPVSPHQRHVHLL